MHALTDAERQARSPVPAGRTWASAQVRAFVLTGLEGTVVFSVLLALLRWHG